MNKYQKVIEKIVRNGNGKHRPAYKIIKKVYIDTIKELGLNFDQVIELKNEYKMSRNDK